MEFFWAEKVEMERKPFRENLDGIEKWGKRGGQGVGEEEEGEEEEEEKEQDGRLLDCGGSLGQHFLTFTRENENRMAVEVKRPC